MRGGTVSQLLLCLRKSNVEALLGRRRAFQKKAERNSRLACPGIPLEQKYVPGGEAAA